MNERHAVPVVTRPHVAIYIPTLVGGGAEQSMVRLAGAFADRGYTVDLVLNRRFGAYADRIPPGINVVELARHSKMRGRLDVLRAYPHDIGAMLRPVLVARTPIMTLRYLAGLADYLAGQRPAVLISALFYANLLAIWARRLARVNTRMIVTEHNTLSRRIEAGMTHRAERARWQYLAPLVGRVYARADAVVAVSDGVAAALATTTGLDRHALKTIHNPVVFPMLPMLAAETVTHPWLEPGAPPVILAAGRLEAQKDFSTLLEAFSRLRRERNARLMILGEGRLRDALQRQAHAYGLANDVALPGWVDNPYAYMRHAGVFVLSSVWEGLGNVLIEAMACGCAVVATNCPSGPSEILADGAHGTLVPMRDPRALARAIGETLDTPHDADKLRRRADDFSIERSASRYVALVDDVLARNLRSGCDPDADTSLD